jgi:uncharacterized protein
MIRAVLDANVFVSATLSPKGNPAKILNAWRDDKFLLLISRPILEEIGRVLRYPKIKKRHRWSERKIQTFLQDLSRLTIVTPGKLSLAIIADDPSDDRYVECAVEGEADYLVSGDKHLLNLGAHKDFMIVRPREFCDVITEKLGS